MPIQEQRENSLRQPVWVKVKNQGTRRDFRGRGALGQIVRAPEKPSAGPWEPNYQQWGKNIPEKKLLLHLTWVDRPPELVAVAAAGCADKTARVVCGCVSRLTSDFCQPM
jgi:hypothetical protein